MSALEDYLREARTIRPLAVRETSYYPALAQLLDRVGRTLTPVVKCVVHAQNRGRGIPDIGLFTWDQVVRSQDNPLARGVKPARGVVEAKGANANLDGIISSEQVSNYLDDHGQVLVTNLREFVLVLRDDQGTLIREEGFQLATNEAEFWALAATAHDLEPALSERFEQYLRRVMMRSAPLAAPRDVAFFLASYARDALARIEHRGLPGLQAVRDAMEDDLGLHFDDERGDHFFRSTLVQTLFYGLFSAWVLWSKTNPVGTNAQFDWRTTLFHLRVPAIRALFQQVASPYTLGPLGLMETLDWAAETLNRVDRASFFESFQQDHAVQYFYEPFLEQFDPELRKELGVWYTPPEVVEYMVGRVDAALRSELGIVDGLADDRVHVLDPCTGTGSYLVEVIKRIERTLRSKGNDALVPYRLKQAAIRRLHGFEILPAPLVVTHLQLGLLLQQLGAPLSDERQERMSVYLTNALTGWESGPTAHQQEAFFPELQAERDAAANIKREAEILVVLGNPPYNGFAGQAPDSEGTLTGAYRRAVHTLQPEGQGLNDLYVRFFRMAERRIVEQTGEGLVCFVSNYSWLDGRSFTAMRERYLDVFDRIFLDRLNGDRYKTGKLTPAGAPDPSIFSTERNREGIQVGTGIALLVRKRGHASATSVRFRDLWGEDKRAQLRNETDASTDRLGYAEVVPETTLGLPFVPMTLNPHYTEWPSVATLLPRGFPGVKTSRDDLVVDIDRDRLEGRIRRYLDERVSHEEARRLFPSAMGGGNQTDREAARDRLRRRGFRPEQIVRYLYRPFDERWLYWEPSERLLDRPREDYAAQVFDGNVWLTANQRNRKEEYYQPQFTTLLADHHVVESNVTMFPLYLRSQQARLAAGAVEEVAAPNLSDAARRYLSTLQVPPDALFHHILAIIHSPSYVFVNSGALRQEWPHIPLPNDRDLLLASASLGLRLRELLDPSTSVQGVTTEGSLLEEYRRITVPTPTSDRPIDPDAGDLVLTVNWGYRNPRGAVMPGGGRALEREFEEAERAAISRAGNPLGLQMPDDVPLGQTTFDVYLNDRVYWRNVPSRVWGYTLGGYSNVLKKWLSYREEDVLGRSLTVDELNTFSSIARRVAAILMLQPKLDANYRDVTAITYDWSVSRAEASQSALLW